MSRNPILPPLHAVSIVVAALGSGCAADVVDNLTSNVQSVARRPLFECDTMVSSGLQAAINAAPTTDPPYVICAMPGLYNESININKPLVLQGPQAGVDPVDGGRGGSPGNEARIASQYAVQISSSNVVFTGFEVADFRYGVNVNYDNYGFPPPDYALHDIEVSYNWIHANDAWVGFTTAPGLLQHLTLTHNIIHVDNVSPGGDAYALAAIGFSGGNTTDGHPRYEDITISYNDVSNGSDWYGFFCGADTSTYLIDGIAIVGNLLQTPGDGANYNCGNIDGATVVDNVVLYTGGSLGLQNALVQNNTFAEGASLSLWGNEYGFTRPSTNVQVINNTFTSEGPYGLAFRVRAGVDATTITFASNAILDGGIEVVDPPGDPTVDPTGWVIRNFGTGTLDAELNWWGSADGPAAHSGSIAGEVDANPWIASVTYVGDLIVETTPLTLAAAVTVSDDTHPPVNVLFLVDGTPVGQATTNGDGIARLAWTPPSYGAYTVVAFAGATSTPTDVAYVAPRTPTTLTYDGPWLDADGNGSTTLLAHLSSDAVACTQGKAVTFTLDGTELTGTTGTDGVVLVTWDGSVDGVYDLIVAFDGDTLCGPSSDTSMITIAPPGSFGVGGGWYKPTQQPVTKASFGFVAQRHCTRRGGCTVGGQLVWMHHKVNRLKSTAITGISAPTATAGFGSCSLMSGVGTLTSWDAIAGEWTAPQEGVPFVATACDGGTSTKKGRTTNKPDAFGISIETRILPGETAPILLSGGSVTLKN